MSSNAMKSQGTKFYVGTVGSPNDYAAIPEIKTIGGPNGQANLIDVTDLDSAGKEYLVGIKDEGEITLGIHYIPTNSAHAALRNAFSSGTLKAFKVTFTDTGATNWEFSGYVTGFAGAVGVDAAVTASVTLKISGAITEH